MEPKHTPPAWPADPDAWVRSDQVAARLGYRTTKSFLNQRRTLADMDFPEPILPRRWRAGQVDAWLRARERLTLTAAANDDFLSGSMRSSRDDKSCPARAAMAAARKRAGAR